jgi:hypothetical protein
MRDLRQKDRCADMIQIELPDCPCATCWKKPSTKLFISTVVNGAVFGVMLCDECLKKVLAREEWENEVRLVSKNKIVQ